MKIWILSLISAMGMVFSPFVYAEENVMRYGVVSLSETAIQSVDRDEMIVELTVEEKHMNRITAANRVTKRLNNVIQAAKRSPQLKVTLQSRSAYPIEDRQNGKVIYQGWQDRAVVMISSQDFTALNQLIAQVQNDAAIGSIRYTVSSRALKQSEMRLTQQAVQHFRNRAAVIAHELGGSGYRIIEMDIDNIGSSSFQPRAVMLRAKAMLAEIQETAAGSTEIQLSVRGRIEITGLPSLQ